MGKPNSTSAPGGHRSLLIGASHHLHAPFQVGSHHYARHFLSAGWRVGMISRPITPFHLPGLRSAEMQGRWRAWRNRGGDDGVIHYTPLSVMPLVSVGLRSTRVIRHWPQLTIPPMRRALRRLGFDRPDVLLLDTPLQAGLPDLVSPRLFVYRVADFTPGFGLPAIDRLEAELVRRADLVIYTTRSLEGYVAGLGPRSAMLVENGVDFERFRRPPNAHPPEDMRLIPHPRAVYVGALQEWFDYELVDRLCRQFPATHFVIIGPERASRFRPHPNLHILGQRPAAQVPSYLWSADVGIIPFDVHGSRDLVNGINPLKLYEYMAASLPVVSADWDAVRELSSPALLARTFDDFAFALTHALEQRDALAQAGVAFAQEADWCRRLGNFEDELSRRLAAIR